MHRLQFVLLVAAWAFASVVVIPAGTATAQTDGVLQLGDEMGAFLQRQQTLGNLPHAFLTHQPLSAYDARRYLDSLLVIEDRLAPNDRRLLRRHLGHDPLPGANTLDGIYDQLYENGRDMISVEGEGYAFQINPLLYLSGGVASQSHRPDRKRNVATWRNSRGIRASGRFGAHIFAEARLEETQRTDPVGSRAILRERFGRITDTSTPSKSKLDYFVATGLVGYKSDLFEVRLGRDRNNWASGPTSLLLSGHAHGYDQLQIRTTFWRIQYSNLYTVLIDRSMGIDTVGAARPAKYGVFHRMALQIGRSAEVGIFEAAVIAPNDFDSNGSYLGFLNPLIFFRAVDGDIGSPGNIVIGIDGRWTVTRGVGVYGQLMLDELDVDKFFSHPDWWKNTYGVQVGTHLIPSFAPNVDFRIEYARIRPYTYSNKTGTLSYWNQRGTLGHVAGPNAEEVALFAHVDIGRKTDAAFLATFGRRGRNVAARNFGSDPLTPYTVDRVDDDGNPLEYGVHLLQGVRQTRFFLESRISREVLPRMHVEAVIRYEAVDDERTGLDRYVAPSASIRWGIPFSRLRY